MSQESVEVKLRKRSRGASSDRGLDTADALKTSSLEEDDEAPPPKARTDRLAHVSSGNNGASGSAAELRAPVPDDEDEAGPVPIPRKAPPAPATQEDEDDEAPPPAVVRRNTSNDSAPPKARSSSQTGVVLSPKKSVSSAGAPQSPLLGSGSQKGDDIAAPATANSSPSQTALLASTPTPGKPTPPSKAKAKAASPVKTVLTPGKWQYKHDLRLKDTNAKAWKDYDASDNKWIEKEYAKAVAARDKKGGKGELGEVTLNGGEYGVHFDDLVQFRRDDRQRQRPVRRV